MKRPDEIDINDKVGLQKLMQDRAATLRLEKAYKEAASKNLQHFDFDGQICLTVYAKYLIEYLKNELKTNGCIIDDGDYDGSTLDDDDNDNELLDSDDE